MSMTREEIIHEYEDAVAAHAVAAAAGIKGAEKSYELFKAGLEALRPVSREQVENVWRGEWNVIYDELNGFTYVTCSKCRDETVLNGCFVTVEGEPCDLEDFCPHCGAPMTDEAMQMVMERMEALHENIHND